MQIKTSESKSESVAIHHAQDCTLNTVTMLLVFYETIQCYINRGNLLLAQILSMPYPPINYNTTQS